MKHYNFINLSNDSILAIVNNSIRIDCLLENLNDDLRQKKFHGKVFIDLLLSNGLTRKRFFTIYFNGSILDINDFSNKEIVPDYVINESNNYFIHHPSLLDKGILTSSAKKRFLELKVN